MFESLVFIETGAGDGEKNTRSNIAYNPSRIAFVSLTLLMFCFFKVVNKYCNVPGSR